MSETAPGNGRMKVAYLDAFSGISGDMLIGALLQLGVSLDALQRELQKLAVTGYQLRQESIWRGGIRACRFVVTLSEQQPARPFPVIARLLEESAVATPVKRAALDVFARLAQAEGRVHGVAADAVHFHEVGGVDAIVDVVGAVFGLATLGVDCVYVSPLPLGRGFVRSIHGILPVPAPATVELLKGFPVRWEDGAAELVTPTGAAIIAALARPDPLPPLRVLQIGYGAGSRELADRPNVLRLVVGELAETTRTERLAVLETNIDDLNPEIFEYVMDRLLEAGALDVCFIPVHMKKNRPGMLVWVLCEVALQAGLRAILFAETTTIGIRSYFVDRVSLRRDQKQIMTPYGHVSVKIALQPDGRATVAPEYEACKRAARQHGVPLKVVYEAALRAAAEAGIGSSRPGAC